MVKILNDLRLNHSVIGVKAEFEAEGSRLNELMRLKDIVSLAGLILTIKIGGAEALSDLYDARLIGAHKIVAPMIESAYALKKFISVIKKVYSSVEERKSVSFFINIETSVGYMNIDDILKLDEIDLLSGIVLGRSDMACSLGLSKQDVNSSLLLDRAIGISEKLKNTKLKLIIGGSVDSNSLPFLRRVSAAKLQAFETRKVIFKCPEALGDDAEEGIKKALEFELLWLKEKKRAYLAMSAEDDERIASLHCKLKI